MKFLIALIFVFAVALAAPNPDNFIFKVNQGRSGSCGGPVLPPTYPSTYGVPPTTSYSAPPTSSEATPPPGTSAPASYLAYPYYPITSSSDINPVYGR